VKRIGTAWIKKNAYWAVSLCLFLAIAGSVVLYTNNKKQEYQMLFLGDSIIGKVRNAANFTDMLEESLGISIYNGALGGSMMARQKGADRAADMSSSLSMAGLTEAMVAEDFSVQMACVGDYAARYLSKDVFLDTIRGLSGVDLEKLEYIVIEHGVNDYASGVPLDNPEDPMDPYTFGGALRTALTLLREKCPHARIIICTPIYCWFPDLGQDCAQADFGHGILEDYVNLELQIAREYDVDVIDNYHNSGIGGEGCDFEEWSVYTIDGMHLNEYGEELLTDALAEQMKGWIE